MILSPPTQKAELIRNSLPVEKDESVIPLPANPVKGQSKASDTLSTTRPKGLRLRRGVKDLESVERSWKC